MRGTPHPPGEPHAGTSGVGICMLSATGRMSRCSAGFCSIFGYPGEDLEGMPFAALAEGSELSRIAAVLDALGGGTTAEQSGRCHAVHRDGAVLDIAFSIVLAAEGFILAVSPVASASADELAAESARLSLLFNDSPDAYFVISARDVKIIDCNRSAERMLGVGRDRIIGHSPAEFEPVHQPDGRTTVDLITDILSRAKRDGTARADVLRLRPDGTHFWVAASVSLTQVGGSDVNLWSWRDIGERKKLEQDLERARRKAEAANLAKSEFLAAMSHEIRTPLNAVINTAHLLRHGRVLPEQEADLDVIEAAGGALLMVVNDVLDISKIEAGEFTLDPRPFSLPELVRDTLKLFETPCQRKGLAVGIDGDLATLPPVLLGDSDCIRHILTNLLSNAVKFTAQGRIGIAVETASTPPAQGRRRLRFTVSDTGIGIAEDKIGRLFRAFSQADGSTTRRYGGTGLGLFIVRRLVELMNGRVGVHSRPGTGSQFWFEVDLEPVGAAETVRRDGATQGALVIWHLDASRTEQDAFRQICDRFGWQVHACASARDLAAALAPDAGGNRPDVLVTGAGEVALSGLAPVGLPVLHRAGPVSGMAARDLFEDLDALFRAAGREPGFLLGRTSLKAGGFAWLAGITVMAVDDSGTNLETLSRILESAGARCIACGSGAAAVEKARAEAAAIDLILMDLQMPEMDGCEASTVIRRIPEARSVPILALTAGATTTEKDRALAVGMSDFLTKPMDAERLIRTVRRHVEAYRGKAPLPRAAQPA